MDVVKAVMRHQLIATDFVPFTGGGNFGGPKRVNAQANCRPPGYCVLNELHLFAVISKEKRAGSFQALLSHYLLVGFDFKLGTHRAVGPHDADDVGTGLIAEAEMEQWPGDRLFLEDHSGPHFHFAADAKWINALIGDGLGRMRSHHLPMI